MPSDATLGTVIEAALPGAMIVRHKPLYGGVSADVTMIEVKTPSGEQRKCVLREHGDRHCGHPARLEFELLRALFDLGLPVAEPLAFGEGGGATSLPWVLIAFVEGATPVPTQTADTRIDAMADQLFALHSAPTETLPDLPLRVDPQPELLGFLPATEEWQGLREALSRMGPQASTATPELLHGDYWPANIIFENDTIKAVIDWEDAALGDPLSDVACAMLELRYIYGPWGAERFVQRYSRHRPIDQQRLFLWQAYVTASGVKSMSGWGLEPAREARMRRTALESLHEAAHQIVDISA